MSVRILCDCDGVLSDFVGAVIDYVARTYGMRVCREAIDKWDCFAAVGCGGEWPRFHTACDELQLCRRMAELPGARELWSAVLAADPDARVCTTPMTPKWLTQRAEWLIEFGVPLVSQIQVHGKEALARAGVILIDDRAENCEAFVRAGGRAYCIATPYNAHLDELTHDMALVVRPQRGTHAECVAWLRELAAQ